VQGGVKFHALIVPPTEFGAQLGGVLHGIQAGKINNGQALDELRDRLPGTPTAASNEYRANFLTAIGDIVSRATIIASLDNVRVIDTEFDFPDRSKANYIRKLRVYVRNESDRDVKLREPKWYPDTRGPAPQYPYLSRFQRRAGQSWDKDELETITVRRAEEIRLWVGLDRDKTPEELRKRHANRIMGTLEIPATIASVDDFVRQKM
jgi:hypothetical protein